MQNLTGFEGKKDKEQKGNVDVRRCPISKMEKSSAVQTHATGGKFGEAGLTFCFFVWLSRATELTSSFHHMTRCWWFGTGKI